LEREKQEAIVFTGTPRIWHEFFMMSAFAKDLAEQYATLFEEHAVEMEQMGDLTAQVLREMGLRVGPIMRIQRAIAAYLEIHKKPPPKV
jgi:hypothetical protein